MFQRAPLSSYCATGFHGSDTILGASCCWPATTACLVTGGKQREPTGGAAAGEDLRTGAPMSKKEKRRLAKEVQRGPADVIHVRKKRKDY